MSFDGQKLFELLPALHRLRDAQFAQSQSFLTPAEQAELAALQALPAPLPSFDQQRHDQLVAKAARGPLQSLLILIAEQVAVVEEDLEQLYDNQFIETCAPWVIPYIGDLIGYQAVHGVTPGVASPRAEVAHTISFRRRKGTVLVLEQLARDITGWGAHAVEFFKLLADTQYMNHVRPHNHYAPDLRHWRPRVHMDTGFDATAHKVDVRRIAIERGRYNIPNIGIFLWSLNPYSVIMSPAAPVAGDARCFRFSTLGRDIPLFNRQVSQGADIAAPARPRNVPDRLRRHVLCQDIRDIDAGLPAVYYGRTNSLALYVGGQFIAASAIQVCDLSGADGGWVNKPDPAGIYEAAIDPHLGRIALRQAPTGAQDVRTLYYYGFNADMGGGEYPRADSFAAPSKQAVIHVPGDFPTIQQALDALPGDGVVEITDSNLYAEPAGLSVDVSAHGHIELRARDGCRPTVTLGAEMTVAGGQEGAFDLNGLLLTAAGSPAAASAALLRAPATRLGGQTNELSRLGLAHCTLVPGWALTPQGDPQFAGQPALVSEPAGLRVVVDKSILGAVRAPELASIAISDSFIDANATTNVAYAALDGNGAGGALTLQGCTVVGKIHATLLALVSNCIVWADLAAGDSWKAALWGDRRQQGCVRFSYLPRHSITPRRYQCVVESLATPGPLFESLRYGDPAYGKLMPATADNVRRGADDGGEMGAFHFVLSTLRETDLRVRIQEYLPVGLDFGIFYET
jgi:hypothetical protein